MKQNAASKGSVVSEITGNIGKSSAVYVMDFLGMTVAEVNDIRARFRAEKVYYKVAKNTLIKRALADKNITGLDAFLKGPTAVAISLGDEVAPAKIVIEYAKKHKTNLPKLKAASIDGQVFNEKQVEAISKLPGKKELIGMVAGTLNAPLVKFAGTLQALVVQIAYAVDAVREKKAQEQG